MRFSEIEGYEALKSTLIKTVVEQRVSHAQLFHGPENSAKLALAIAYAQFLNCTGRKLPARTDDPAAIDSCGSCPSCQQFHILAHPDLHFIFPVSATKKVKKPQSRFFLDEWRNLLKEKNFTITLPEWFDAAGLENKQGIINTEDCTEIITTLSYKSYESEYKVMIIWMVERLFHAAAPKILKILEEPPDKTLFILITEDPRQVLDTILSRTQLVRIPPAGGQQAEQSEEERAEFQMFRQWMRDCYSNSVPALLKFSADISKSIREEQKSLLQRGMRFVGQASLMHHTGRMASGVTEEEADFIRKFSPFMTPQAVEELNRLLNDAIYHIERNGYGQAVFLDLSLKAARIFKPGFAREPAR